MKFLIDECISHSSFARLADRGYPDGVHPIHIGLRARHDGEIVARALNDDRIIATCNAADFRDLLGREAVHPGLILLPNATLEQSWRLLELALSFIELHERPADYMINRVVEVSADHGIQPYELPPADGD